MYYTFGLPVNCMEFSDENPNVIVDCSDDVLNARVETIEGKLENLRGFYSIQVLT